MRWNAVFAYLQPARSRTNLTIRANAEAERLLLDGDRATGAVVDGETIEADVIVVSAGAIGSPRILLRSGIDAGSNLQDHVSAKLVFETTGALRTESPMPFAGGIVKTPDLHLLPIVDRYGTSAHITVALLRPYSRGRVTLDAVEHRLLSDPRDRTALENGLELLRGLSGLVAQQISTTAGKVDVARTLVILFAGFQHINGFGCLTVVHEENGLHNGDEHGLEPGIQRSTAAHIFDQTPGLGFTARKGRNFSREDGNIGAVREGQSCGCPGDRLGMSGSASFQRARKS